MRRSGRGTQREHGVAVGARGAGEHHLAVLLDDALGERGALGGGSAAAGRRRAAGAAPTRARRTRADHPRRVDVAGVEESGAGGLVDLAQQGVGVEQAEFGGDLVLFLEGEPVGGAAGGEVQGVTDVEEAAAGLGEALAGGVGEPGGGDGAQGGGVAQAAAGLLEVGFEEVLEFALAFGAFGAEFLEFGQALGGLVAPVGEDGGAAGRR
ncbi:hypothetical protein SFUMM280S_11465 [Streptomyces fumanus]